MKSFLFKGIILFAVLALSGCATVYRAYRGDELPRHQIAVLKVPDEIWLNKVDGKLTSVFTPTFREARLLPGRHKISVSLNLDTSRVSSVQGASLVIDFVAEAGHVYDVNWKISGERWSAWVEDITKKEQDR